MRASAAAVCGIALEVLALAFAWADERPGVAAALGILIAVAAAGAGGPWAGALVGLVGWAVFTLLVAEDALAALPALPAWVAAPALVGWLAGRVARVQRERERATAELSAFRRSTAEAVVAVAGDGTVTSWSPGAEALFGHEPDEAVGASLFALVPDESGDLRRLVERASRGEPDERQELSLRRKDGEAARVSAVACPVPGPEGGLASVVVLASDVSATAALRERVAEAEWKHRALVEALPLVTYEHDPADRGSLRYVSPQVERLLGYAPGEWLAERDLFLRLVHPEDRDRVLEGLAETAETGKPFRSEYRMLSRGGHVVWVRDEATTVRDGGGEPLYTQGSLVDVSGRRRAEDERERVRADARAAIADATERQGRLDLVTRAGDLLSSTVDPSVTLRRLAEAATREFADWCLVDVLADDGALRRLAAAHGGLLSELGSGRLAPPAPEPEPHLLGVVAARRAETGPPVGGSEGWDASADPFPGGSFISVPMLSRDRCLGAVTFVSLASRRVYGADDVLLAQDVARRAAAALDVDRLQREVEQRAEVADVLAHLPIGACLVDRSGVVRVWNPAAEAVLGRPAASVVGAPITAAVPGWDRVAGRIPVSATLPPPGVESVPVETPAGQRWIAIAALAFPGGTVYAFRDVTDERHVEELKAEFVATASHELRTPLAAVYGAAQTLRRHDFALDEAGRERFVSLIVDESERLGRIVNEILLANQLDAGRVELTSEPFDARELVERVVESTRAHLPPGTEVEADGTPGAAVAADRDKVRQVLVNLVENAIKYSPDGGRIEVGAEPGDGAVRFHVRDEGLGIPPDEQERIFEKFYRLDPQMTRGVGGTGLGLYICSELVERMGGRIWVESSQGEGSAFFFELPAAEAGAA